MAQTIKLKRSATQNAVPSTSSLALGEIAINTYDGKLFIKKNDGSESIVTIGTLENNAVTSAKIAANAVTSSEIAKNAVGTSEIAANSVGISELNVSDGSDGQVLTTNGSGTLSFTSKSASAQSFYLNTATGDGNTAGFTLSTTPASESYIIAFIDGVFQNQDSYTFSGTTLTFDTAPANGTTVTVYVVGSIYSGNSVVLDTFSGDDSETAFTLSENPQSENNTQVYIDGVYQQKSEYSVSGQTLTFSSPPPTGTSNIEVIAFTSTNLTVLNANSVTSASIASGAVNTVDIADNAITSAKIASGVIVASDVADNSITSAKIALNAVGASELAATALSGHDTDDLSEGSTNLYYTDARVGTYISGNRSFGNITTTGYLAGPATFTIDPAAVGDNTGTVVIAGNLQVDGTTTTINSTTLTVDDKLVTLASGSINAAAADGAGIEVEISGATNPSILYDGTNDEWDFNKDITTTGYIGAGTSNPANLLHLESSGSDFATIRLNAPSNTTPGQFLLRAHDGVFDIRNANNSTTDLTINASGNVGIGISSPASLLHVAKTSGTDVDIARFSGASSAFNIQCSDLSAATPVWTLRTFSGEILAFGEGLNESGRFDGSGNFLVGKTSQDQTAIGAELRENGIAAFTADATAPLRANRKTSDGNIVNFQKDNTTVGTIGTTSGRLTVGSGDTGLRFVGDADEITPWNTSTNAISDNLLDLGNTNNRFKDLYLAGTLTNDGTGGISIDTSGNVGIGTSSPAGNLQISGSGDRSLLITGGTAGTTSVQMGDSVDQDAGAIRYDNSNNSMQFVSNASERMRINSSGNVGIGETAPLGKLHIKGNDVGATASAQGNSLILEDTENGLSILSSTAGAGYINFGDSDDNNVGMIIYGHSSNAMNFWTNAAERMRINSSGNVGIGTSSPLEQLHVQLPSGTNGDIIALARSGGAYRFQLGLDGNSNFYVSNNSDEKIFNVNYTGEVGIGTAGPTAKLEVSGGDAYFYNTATTGGIRIGYNSSNYWDIKRENASIGNLRFYHGGNERVSFLPGGGITFNGDTAAANALDDYEEGTWTPVLSASTTAPSVTYVSPYTQGRYIKIGGMVYATFEVRYTAQSGGSGHAIIGGLPFTRYNGYPDADRGSPADTYGITYPTTADTYGYFILSSNTTYMYVNYARSGSTPLNLNITGCGTSSGLGFIRGSITYTVV